MKGKPTKSILLIEDDELDVISMQRSLQRLDMDFQLYTAYNGIEALALLRGEGEVRMDAFPDMVLLDMNMPRMNGLEFLKVLRADADSALAHLRVYVMTTSNEMNDRELMEQLGVSGYLIKPLNFYDNSKRLSAMDDFMQFHLLKILHHPNE